MNTISIDINSIPEVRLRSSFRVLRREVNRLLRTPEGRADFEKWKKEREEEK